MKLKEAQTFIRAFTNPRARTLVKRMMKTNYLQAVLAHHPDNTTLNPVEIEEKCINMVDSIFSRIKKTIPYPEKIFTQFMILSRNNPDRDGIWFDEFIAAYENYKHNIKLKKRYDRLKQFICGHSFCDVGCGGGDLVAYVKKNHRGITCAYGIDVMDWRTEEVKKKINFEMLDFSRPGVTSVRQFDTVTCLAVLHHVGERDEEISIFLQNLKTTLHAESRLIIEEDVIISEKVQKRGSPYAEQINVLKRDQTNYDRFLLLNEKDQRDVIILIDFFANCLAVGVPTMSFPCGFHTIEEWEELFKSSRYRLEDVIIEGFVKDNFNQSSHVLFILTKT
jgi:2-polyprenyl-3-methyl-5-hydroxy-6-metoxy-1,4-benzoquinol methylase